MTPRVNPLTGPVDTKHKSTSLFLQLPGSMRVLVAFLISFTLTLPALAQPAEALTPKVLLGGTVQVLVPAGFAPMSQELLRVKYPSTRRPTLVYSNASGSINLALNHTANPLQPNQLAEMHQAMETMFKRLYPSAVWFQSGLKTINGRAFFLLDLRTPALDTEIRNLMVGTSLQGRLLLITFNVTQQHEARWLPTAQKILASIKVNG